MNPDIEAIFARVNAEVATILLSAEPRFGKVGSLLLLALANAQDTYEQAVCQCEEDVCTCDPITALWVAKAGFLNVLHILDDLTAAALSLLHPKEKPEVLTSDATDLIAKTLEIFRSGHDEIVLTTTPSGPPPGTTIQ